MLLNIVLVISCMEILAVGCFCAGFILGKYSQEREKTKVDSISLDDNVLDPVSPEDQRLFEKLSKDDKEGIYVEEED